MLERLKDIVRNRLLPRSAFRFFVRNWLVPGDAERAAAVFATMRASRVLAAGISPGPAAARIAVIAPHPDDEVIGPGGTLLRALANGTAVSVVYVTDGTSGPDAAARRREAESAARRLGFDAVFLGEPAGAIDISGRAVESFAGAVMKSAPQALFTPFLLDDNDDHRRVSQLLLAAYRRGLLPGALEMWAYQVYAPMPGNVVVDITDVAGRKADAIRLYGSQVAKRDWAHFSLGVNAVSSRLLRGAAGARYAEAFLVLPLSDYAELCSAYFDPDATPCYLSESYRRA